MFRLQSNVYKYIIYSKFINFFPIYYLTEKHFRKYIYSRIIYFHVFKFCRSNITELELVYCFININ